MRSAGRDNAAAQRRQSAALTFRPLLPFTAPQTDAIPTRTAREPNVMTAHRKIFTSRPSALRFMPKAVWPKPGWKPAQGFPNSAFVWHDYAIPSTTIDVLQGFAGSHDPACREALLLLAPHITGLRLEHGACSRIRAGRSRSGKRCNSATGCGCSARCSLIVPASSASKPAAGACTTRASKSTCTRNMCRTARRCGKASSRITIAAGSAPSFEHGDGRGAPMASPVLDPSSAPVAQWRVDSGRRMEFCRLTGDYNPLHLTTPIRPSHGICRRLPHPQRVAAQCLGHLVATGAPPRELDLWIKGPAFFGSAVTLRQESSG